MARRTELGVLANKALNITVLTRKIKCGKCGGNFNRKIEVPLQRTRTKVK